MLALMIMATGGFVWVYGRLSGETVDMSGMTRAIFTSADESVRTEDQTEGIIISGG